MNKKHLVWLFMLMFFLVVSSTDIYIAGLPQLTKTFGVDLNITNLTISAFTIGVAIWTLFVGILSERFGRRRMILVGIGSYTITSFLIAISPNIGMMIFFRFTQSFGAAVILIVARLLIKDCMKEREQINAMGLILLGLILSPSLAPVVGAFLIKWFSWRACFFASSGLGLILWIDCYRTIEETLLVKMKRLPNFFSYINSYKKLLKNPLFLPGVFTLGSVFAAFFTFIGISSYIFINELHISPIAYSYIYALLALAFLTGNSLMRYMNKKGEAKQKIVKYGINCTVFGTVILFLTYVNHSRFYVATVLVIAVLFMRIAVGLINPPIQVTLTNVFGKRGGQALGMASTVQFLLGTLAVTLVSFFSKNPILGLQLVTLFFTCIAGISFVYLQKAFKKIA